jgi:hypothetical protein
MIRLAAARRTGDLSAAEAAVSQAEALASRVPDELARRRHIRARVLADRGAVALWSGRLDEAASILDSGVAVAAASGGEHERASCLGHLALVEALRGRLRRAAKLAGQATAALAPTTARLPRTQAPRRSPRSPGYLEWSELVRRSRLRQLDAALAVGPDKLIGAVAFLLRRTARWPGHGAWPAQMAAGAGPGGSVPRGSTSG